MRKTIFQLVIICFFVGLGTVAASPNTSSTTLLKSDSVAYYADYVDRWGVPEGVLRLTQAQVAVRNSHYRFEYSAGKLLRVVYANSAGTPKEHERQEHAMRPTILDFIYNKGTGRLSEVIHSNHVGYIISSYQIQGEKYDSINIRVRPPLADKLSWPVLGLIENVVSTTKIEPRTPIKNYKLTRNEKGYITKLTFHRNKNNTPVRNAATIFGMKYRLDTLGRIIEVQYLGFDGKPQADNENIGLKQYRYDAHGNICQIVNLDLNKKPTLSRSWWAVTIDSSDVNGNIVESRFYDTENKLCYSEERYAKSVTKYDDRGNNIETSYFDTANKPCYNSSGFFISRSQFDTNGRPIETSFYNTEGKYCLSSRYGYATRRTTYNERGNILDERYFETTGKPYIDRLKGCTGYKAKYDKDGNRIELEFFDLDKGEHSLRENSDISIARYNTKGDLTELRLFHTQWVPTQKKVSTIPPYVADIIKGFDEKIPWGTNEYNYSKFTIKYNPQGYISEIGYWVEKDRNGLNSTYTMLKQVQYQYNQWGDVLVIDHADYEEVEDNNGVLLTTNTENPEKLYQYDTDGNLLIQTLPSSKGNIVTKFDKLGYEVELTCLDTNGTLLPFYFRDTSVVRTVLRYDQKGTKIETIDFDKDGNQTIHPIIYTGIFDNLGRLVGRTCFNVRKSHNAEKLIYTYNGKGDCVKGHYVNKKGELCIGDDQYAKVTNSYDERGNNIESRYYDLEGNLCMRDTDYAQVITKYNERGDIIAEAFYDKTGKLCKPNDSSYARAVWSYSRIGRLIKQMSYDENGEEVPEECSYEDHDSL